ncbi:hypothetical protein BT69DRAFT_1349773 [Atractiella rhizophila]|nr:hypothetical protein BT69DRAFT_1349773 [Atractiella rhizophila]
MACTAVTMSCVYEYTVTNWGNESYLLRQGWQFPAYVLLTASVAIIVQSYFIQRYLRLSRNPIVTGLLAVLALLAFAGSIALSATVIKYTEYTERGHIKVPAILWAGTKALCETRKLIAALCLLAIETSTPTAVIAVTALITYLQNNATNVPTGMLFNLGRAYSITLLVNLLMRESLTTPGNTTGPKSMANTPSMLMNAISVQHEPIVQVEREHSTAEELGDDEKAVPIKGPGFTGGKNISSNPNAYQVSYPQISRTSSITS